MHRRLRRCTALLFVAIAFIASNTVQSASARTPASAATTGAPYCGKTIYKSTNVAWKCTFAEEFSNATIDANKWWKLTTAQTGFGAGQECFVTSSNNISVSGGYLNLTVRKEAAPFSCTTPSGSFTTQYTRDRKSTRLNSSHMSISYAVFCL